MTTDWRPDEQLKLWTVLNIGLNCIKPDRHKLRRKISIKMVMNTLTSLRDELSRAPIITTGNEPVKYQRAAFSEKL